MPSKNSPKKGLEQVSTAAKNIKKGNKNNAKQNSAYTTVDDTDGNGLVDGSEKTGYQLYISGNGIFITTESGKKFSDATSEKWSAIAAAPVEKGHHVLIANNQSKKTRYRIWKLSSKAIVRSKGRWLSERALSSKGYEQVFGIDFNGDGIIEADTLIDAGDADISLMGTAMVGKRLRARRAADDPDGNGRLLITWQSSSEASIWTTADTGKSILIPATLEGAQVRARVEYKDGDGFKETVFTQSRLIPYIDNGDAAFLIQGTPAVGQTLSITQSVADPDGDGTTSFSWFQSSDGINWSLINSSPTFTIPDNLEGQNLTATVRYTDGQGFEESVSTNAVSIPYIDNGDAAFLIQGTPAVGQTLSITQSVADPDGDGTTSFSWLQSSDGINWSLINSSPTFTIPSNLQGQNITATVRYTDGQGFEESVSTNVVSIPYIDNGEPAAPSPAPATGFSSLDGYGRVNASAAFEDLLGINLPDVPSLGGNFWGLDNTNVPEVWAGGNEFAGVKGAGVTIAVIDTGVDLDHPEFSGRIVAGYDFVDGDAIPDDIDGHGTHIAGTIAGRDDDNSGISGVAPAANIMPVRVLSDTGRGWTSDIVAGIRWAVNNGADVINLSLGGDRYTRSMAEALRFATERGSVVVMAAGNNGEQSPRYPGAHAVDYGIAVGAVDRNQNFADFSNKAGSNTLDYVTAPGVSIYSTAPGGGYAFDSGTSMATPHVAGIAGLLKSHDRTLTAEAIENLLTRSAHNFSTSNASRNADPLTGQFESQTITLETLETFADSEFNATLIGSLNGNLKSRKSTIQQLKADMNQGVNIDDINVIPSTRKNFITIDLSDSHQSDKSSLIENWLTSDQFNYFEIDTRVSVV